MGSRIGAIVRGALLGAGILLMIGLWSADIGFAQNKSSGGSASFTGVAEFVGVPALEFGFVFGLVFASIEARRPFWDTIRGVGKMSWIFVGLHVVVFWGIY